MGQCPLPSMSILTELEFLCADNIFELSVQSRLVLGSGHSQSSTVMCPVAGKRAYVTLSNCMNIIFRLNTCTEKLINFAVEKIDFCVNFCPTARNKSRHRPNRSHINNSGEQQQSHVP